jgi:hypothetical protein
VTLGQFLPPNPSLSNPLISYSPRALWTDLDLFFWVVHRVPETTLVAARPGDIFVHVSSSTRSHSSRAARPGDRESDLAFLPSFAFGSVLAKHRQSVPPERRLSSGCSRFCCSGSWRSARYARASSLPSSFLQSEFFFLLIRLLSFPLQSSSSDTPSVEVARLLTARLLMMPTT